MEEVNIVRFLVVLRDLVEINEEGEWIISIYDVDILVVLVLFILMIAEFPPLHILVGQLFT